MWGVSSERANSQSWVGVVTVGLSCNYSVTAVDVSKATSSYAESNRILRTKTDRWIKRDLPIFKYVCY